MSLINDDCKGLVFQFLHQIMDVHELVDGCNNDLGIAVQCICQIFGTALFIHDLDQTGLMLHAQHGSLQLTVDHNTVSDNANSIKDHIILSIMQGRQTMSQPSNGVGFTTACGVLDQIVLV